jgi:hypothetical protein
LLFTTIAGCGDDDNPLTPDTTAPTVNAGNSPSNNSVNVPLNTNVTASFSEIMTSSTVSAATFTLKQGATAVPSTVTYSSGVGAVLHPNAQLLPNAAYTAMISTGAEDLAGNGIATNFIWNFTTGATIDATPPVVASTVPQNGASSVALTATVSAVFSEALDPLTISTSTFLLKRGATAVAGSVSYSGNTAVFTPSAALLNNTEYTATLTTAVTDLSGNILIQPKVWTFTTVSSTDGVAPVVVSVVPANTASAISASANVSATFSEPMNAGTITASSFTLSQGATPVAGAVTYSGTTATFNPTNNLGIGLLYTATITTVAKDVAGNALAAAYVWTFTTSANPDGTAPTVVATVPANGAVNVPLSSNLSITFSEAMNPATLSAANVSLTFGSIQYDGIVTVSGNTLIFNPTSDLAPNLVYTARVLTGVTDLAGNPMAANYTWTFTTITPIPPPDVTRPTVVTVVPSNGSSNVAASSTIGVGFSEPINPSSITSSTFTLRKGGVLVAGVVTPFHTGASFDPTDPMTLGEVYTATITTGVMDLAGNALAVNYVWSFTVNGDINVDLPAVISVTPENEAVDVSTIANISATFSEPMNAATLTTATFRLTDGSGFVSGSVSYSGSTATFNPSTRLTPNTLYNGTITTGAQDASGNGLAADFEWIFITEPIPEITGVVPTVDGLNVPITVNVAASFTKPMKASTLTTESFVIRTATSWVPGTVTTVGAAVVFKPTSNLSPNTVYSATISAVATDLSGNPLAYDYTWFFTTGSATDNVGPIVTASDPAAGATNVPRGAAIRAYFNDAIDPTTLTTSTFTVTAGSNQAVGVVSYPETIAIFTPTVLLAPSTVYTVTITTAVKDISGNALASQKVWTFTTRP